MQRVTDVRKSVGPGADFIFAAISPCFAKISAVHPRQPFIPSSSAPREDERVMRNYSAIAREDAGEFPPRNVGQAADVGNRRRVRIPHLKTREEASDVKRNVWRYRGKE